MNSIVERRVEFATPWFEVVSKQVKGEPAPYYSLQMLDYVTVVAITPENQLVLVRQYRPAAERITLELPSGHVEKNETPLASAQRELAEETGFHATGLQPLGKLLSDSGRNENRIWCFLAEGVKPAVGQFAPEAGVEPVLVPIQKVPELVASGEFDHALHLAALMLVMLKRGPAILLERERFRRKPQA